MSKASALTAAAHRLIANNVLTKAGAVIGATATAFTTGVAITTVIDGIMRSVAAFTNQALVALSTSDLATFVQPSGLNAFYTQPANTTVYYVLCVNAAGTPRVVQGTWQGQQVQAGGATVVGDGTVPDVPDGWVPFALIKLASGGAVFIPGTTALTGLATFFDLNVLPAADRP